MAKRKIDGIDADLVQAYEKSKGYQIICDRIASEIARQLELLVQLQPEPETNRIRGRIEAYRTVLQIPAILRTEADDGKPPRLQGRTGKD